VAYWTKILEELAKGDTTTPDGQRLLGESPPDKWLWKYGGTWGGVKSSTHVKRFAWRREERDVKSRNPLGELAVEFSSGGRDRKRIYSSIEYVHFYHLWKMAGSKGKYIFDQITQAGRYYFADNKHKQNPGRIVDSF